MCSVTAENDLITVAFFPDDYICLDTATYDNAICMRLTLKRAARATSLSSVNLNERFC